MAQKWREERMEPNEKVHPSLYKGPDGLFKEMPDISKLGSI
jgi:hypothetical protein